MKVVSDTIERFKKKKKLTNDKIEKFKRKNKN